MICPRGFAASSRASTAGRTWPPDSAWFSGLLSTVASPIQEWLADSAGLMFASALLFGTLVCEGALLLGLGASMLNCLLATIAAGRIGSTAELAAANDASSDMIEAPVAELERRGLLQRAADCGAVCTGCPAEPACAPAGQAHEWILTASGRRYAGH